MYGGGLSAKQSVNTKNLILCLTPKMKNAWVYWAKIILGETEDETHFVLYYLDYDELRMSLLSEAFAQNPKCFGVLMIIEWSGCLILMKVSWLVLFQKLLKKHQQG